MTNRNFPCWSTTRLQEGRKYLVNGCDIGIQREVKEAWGAASMATKLVSRTAFFHGDIL
jgi:hypothetical protein